MTGPTSTDSLRGSPTSSSAIAPFSMASMRSATSSCRQRMRSAEQRWPAESKADDDHVADDLLGKRRGIDDHRVQAAGFGDQRDRLRRARVRRPASSRCDQARDRRRAGEHDALHARIGDQRGADFARARQELQRVARHARFVQQPHRLGGDQRRLLGGLGEHGIARGERGGDLAGEDGERKIPRADADDQARAARARPDRACAPPRRA